MLSFEQQAKLLTPILQKTTNKRCADCGGATPTWASLDFGVFVCSNCSGAHRALGPTITRIKSTTLDKWNSQWVPRMVLGNNELNQFWEADEAAAAAKKPRLGASLDEYNRYVHDKYIRKKFVTDKSAVHPLTAYLNGNYTQPQVQNKEKKESIVPVKPVPQAKLELPRDITGADKANKPKSANFNLLDEDHSEFSSQNNRSDNLNTHSEGHEEKTNNKKDFSNISEPDDEFDDYVEAVDQVPNNQDQMRFDDLFKNPKPNNQPPNPTTHSVGGFPQHNYYGQNFTPNNGMMQHNLHPNMVGMNHMNHMNPNLARHHSAQQQIYGQNNLAHNPYVGYAPHSGHPQGNPHSLSPQPTQQYPQYSNFTLN